MSEFDFPKFLYHGTASDCLDGFKKQLLNKAFWKPNRDFGEGFYTTISPHQAKIWGIKTLEREGYALPLSKLPCVLKIAIHSERLDFSPSIKAFLGSSLSWAQFIFNHRKNVVKDFDPCLNNSHPDIVLGLMADGDTGKIIEKALDESKDVIWFWDNITKDEYKSILDAHELGSQITFCNEKLSSFLELVGYYIFEEEGWVYHDINIRKYGSI